MTYEIIPLAEHLKTCLKNNKPVRNTAIIKTQSEQTINIREPLSLIRQLQSQALKGFKYVTFFKDTENEKMLHALYRIDESETIEFFV